MTRHLSVASAIDKNKISSAAAWIALLEIDVIDPSTRQVVQTLFVARNNEPLTFEGNAYLAGNFDLNISQKADSAPNVTLTAQDQTRYISSQMELMAGGVFSQVTLKIVNGDQLASAAEIEQKFQIVSSAVKDYVVTFQLGAQNLLGVRFPRHMQYRDRCAWRFKGYGCAYAGAVTTCDYTRDGPNGCAAKSNTINFRGLPGLVKMNI